MKKVKANRLRAFIAGLVVFVSVTFAGASELKVAGIFASGMVLQREAKVPVWGWGTPGDRIVVEFKGRKQVAAVDKDGKWSLTLAPLKASAEGAELKISCGGDALVFKDVLVGEVWLASGQSNMDFRLAGALRADEEIAAANYKGLRIFMAHEQFAQSSQSNLPGAWQVCTPANAGTFSAVAYFFGRDIYTNLNVPVGLIVSSVGGTPIETWTAPDVVSADPENQPLLDQWKKVTPGEFHKIDTDFHAYLDELARRNKLSDKGAALPPLVAPTLHCHDCPSSLYNGMIAPLIPYAIRGVVWYQGEQNTGRPTRYVKQLPDLIRQWRRDWREGDFPFYYVQLPNYAPPEAGLKDGFVKLRESQRLALETPELSHIGMAVTIDVGEAHNVHPREKREVGHRLALLALAETYNRRGLTSSGPLFQSLEIRGDKAIVRFKPAKSGLVAKGGPLKGFEVAADDGKFSPAEAAIAGDAVEVRSLLVPRPASVRYAWADDPDGSNLYNTAGLPASPFKAEAR